MPLVSHKMLVFFLSNAPPYSATGDKKRESLKTKRNRIQHKVRKLCLHRAEAELDLKAKEVEKL